MTTPKGSPKPKVEKVRITGSDTRRFPVLLEITKQFVKVQHEGTVSFPGDIERYSLKTGLRIGSGSTPYHLTALDLEKWRARAEEL